MYRKLLLLVVAGSVMAGCASTRLPGTSTHVSTGRTNPPPAMTGNPQQVTEQPRPQVVQPAAAQTTQVQVLPANPQQGVPLSDEVQLEVVPLNAAAATTAPETSIMPAVAAATGSETARTWLSRYPNLSEDLRSPQEIIQRLEQEARNYTEQMDRLRSQVQRNWGNSIHLPSAHEFVKYTDNYQSRGEMDFEQGRIVIETVDRRRPREALTEAIVTTLLTPYDADNPEIYSDKGISYSGPALLAGQVIDHEGQPVQWAWRAQRYADYLVANQLQVVQQNGREVYRVEIPLVSNHTQVRGQQYEHLVRAASQRYQVEEALIYAIMETESHFNPYAMSHIPAYGLMQIVPSTAGRDVFQRIKQRTDQPTSEYLFNPTNNIDTGTAYISILRDVYLKDIRHPLSREYAIIAGYNGGAGNVLRTFNTDRRLAVEVINQLSPQEVYNRLHQRHPSAEARNYLVKVTTALGRYRGSVALNRVRQD